PAAPARADSGVPPAGENRLVPDEVLVTVAATGQQGQSLAGALARAHRLQLLQARRPGALDVTLARFRISGGRPVRDVIAALERDSRVLSAQPNYLYALTGDAPPAAGAGGALAAAQYGLERLRAGVAHVRTKGEGVLAAVIDSGVDAGHRELRGAVAGSVDVAAAAAGRPAPQKTAARAGDADAHGTAMAGVIAARDQMRGVAPASRILALRAFGGGSGRDGAAGSTFAVVLALDEALAAGARVINMSFEGPRDPLLQRALAAAAARGVTLVAAAGNGGPQAPPAWPAADPNVIAVAATDARDARAPMSARGEHVAVAAPGVDIIGPRPGDAYQFASGTSLAAAHVSGVAALALAANPALRGADVRRILMETARDLGPPGRDPDFGAGLVDAAAAVAAAQAAATAPAPAPAGATAGPAAATPDAPAPSGASATQSPRAAGTAAPE
ncbi:S8 family serine peptidase, partial [Camelimonas abortus]